MKTTLLIFVFLIVCPFNISAQVHDIPQKFEGKRGYVQTIDYDTNELLVNFILGKDKEREIVKELIIIISATQFVDSDKKVLTFRDLKSNDEIVVDGQYYKEDKYSEATTVTIVNRKVKPIKEGQLDYIIDDYAFLDGNKIKLEAGKTAKGKKKSGYEDKIKSALSDLKPGDFASASGKYDKTGFYLADEIEFYPNNESKFEKAADTTDVKEYQKFVKDWPDKNKRAKFFNYEIKGIGKVYNSATVQDYVQKVGTKLIPEHIKKRKTFIFIVVDNPIQNANIRSNGLAYIYLGLLKKIENEAQLAAVLSHEISHVIYEHFSKEAMENLKGKKNQKNVEQATDAAKKALEKNKDKDKEHYFNTLEDLRVYSKTEIDGRLSTYSTDQELQADRVGLSLMVLANYDPREACQYWKNNYAYYGETKIPKEMEVVNLTQFTTNKLIGDKSKTEKKPTKKQSDVGKLSSQLSELIDWKKKRTRAATYKTHPENLKRFENLNILVSQYWNEESTLKKSFKGEKEYRQVLDVVGKKGK